MKCDWCDDEAEHQVFDEDGNLHLDLCESCYRSHENGEDDEN